MASRHAPLTLAALLVVLGPGCAPDNTASVQPYSLCTMPDDCTFSGKCDMQPLDAPVLDLSYQAPMWLAVEMRNHLADNADPAVGRLNTHDAHFESYSLSYGGLRPGVAPTSIGDIPSSGGRAQQVIPAGGTAVVGIDVIPSSVVAAIVTAGGIPAGPDYDEVLVTVTFKGRYEDGSKWEAPYRIPVRLCINCLAVPVCENDTQVPTGACPSLAQLPRGAPFCGTAPASCVSAIEGNYCGSNPAVANGDPDTLYVCNGVGNPVNSTACASGCNAAVSPNVCNP